MSQIFKFIRDEKASILPMTALILPLLIGVSGLGVDAGIWAMKKRELQSAADMAAIAAMYEIMNGDEDNAQSTALREAQNHGFEYSGNADDFVVTVDADSDGVRVTLAQSSNVTLFSHHFVEDLVQIRTAARAEGGGTTETDLCFGALSGKFRMTGNSTVTAPTCSAGANSNAADSCEVSGSSGTLELNTIRCSGGYNEDGHPDTDYNEIIENASPFTDPYEDFEIPDYEACANTNRAQSYRTNATATIEPGVFCGGLDLSGQGTITLEPGVYVVDGGDFTAGSGITVEGEGVTIILTSSDGDGDNVGDIRLTGQATLNLSAPEEGEDTEGMLFYQDRIATEDSGHRNNVTGGGDHYLNGVIYTPQRGFRIGGNSGASGTDVCTRIISHTIEINGNPHISNDACEALGVKNISTGDGNRVRLAPLNSGNVDG